MKSLVVAITLVLSTQLVTAAMKAGLDVTVSDQTRVVCSFVIGSNRTIASPPRRLLDDNALLPTLRAKEKSTTFRAGEMLQQTGIRFQENRGQIVDTRGKLRPEIAFVANAPGARLYFRNDGISYVFTKTMHTQTIDLPLEGIATNKGLMDESLSPWGEIQRGENQTYRLDMKLVGSNQFARIRAEGELPGYVNYYLAHCPGGITGVKEYSCIVYEQVYENIDLEIISIDGRMKYNFIVRPGGRVSDIQMQYDGASETALMNDGALSVATPLGRIEEATPYSYSGNERNEVASRFLRKGNTVSFEVDEYDQTQTLVIDPWATYYGGSGGDAASCVRTDVAGNVVVSGITSSVDFPVTVGAFQTAYGGTNDAFLVKFDASGSRLWATYYGGSGSEGPGLIHPQAAIDGDGNTSIAGGTTSSDLPVSVGAFQTSYGGNADAFVAQFSPTGSLQWATYYGGSKEEFSDVAVGVDGDGRVLLTGGTKSTNFPVSPGAYQASHASGNGFDVFVVVLNSDGSRAWATYYGGNKGELGKAIQADENGNIFISGEAMENFPVSPGAYQTVNAGNNDAFIMKFTGGGARLWATYYGGSGNEYLRSIAVDGSGDVIIGGYTTSSNLPSTGGGSQPSSGGGTDGFLVKFTSAGALSWASYCGGSGSDYIRGIATDANANILLAGSTASANFPVTGGAFQTSYAGGGADGFAIKMSAGGAMLWGSFLGGSAQDYARGISANAGGSVFVCGNTYSTDFPTLNPHQSVLAGEGDAFVLSLNSSGAMPGYNAPPVAVASAIPIQGTAPLPVSFSSAGSYDPDGTIQSYSWDFGDNTPLSADQNPSHTYLNAGTYTAVLTVTDDGNKTATANVTVTVFSASSYVWVSDRSVTRFQTGGNKWKGRDVVTILDGSNQPVSGAVVTASYTGPNSGTVSGTTGTNGTVTLETSQRTNPSGTWCFTVTNVQKSGYTFNSTIGEITSCEGSPKVNISVPSSIDVSVYPNPFNPTATIRYSIPEDSHVLLSLYDVHGRIVSELVNSEKQAGTYSVEFDGSNLPSGVYLYRLEAGGQVRVNTMSLVK